MVKRAKKSTLKRVSYIWVLAVAFNAGFEMFGINILGQIFGFLRFLPDLIDFVGMLAALYLIYLAITK